MWGIKLVWHTSCCVYVLILLCRNCFFNFHKKGSHISIPVRFLPVEVRHLLWISHRLFLPVPNERLLLDSRFTEQTKTNKEPFVRSLTFFLSGKYVKTVCLCTIRKDEYIQRLASTNTPRNWKIGCYRTVLKTVILIFYSKKIIDSCDMDKL